MSVSVKCEWCSKEQKVIPARAKTYRFCSYACRGAWRAVNWKGSNHPNWQGDQPRTKQCEHCGGTFVWSGEPITTFVARKFCSQECKRVGQRRLYGADHPNFKGETTRRKNRRGQHGAWARAVIGRDQAICQRCGATGVELHAHHIKSFEHYPELRWDLNNGMTLCHRCHWAEHAASDANGVNSGNILPGHAEDNPEPSDGRKPVEGVTTRGRAYRRWEGHCEECGIFISKRWSDAIGKAHHFCSMSCRSKFSIRNVNARRYGSNYLHERPARKG